MDAKFEARLNMYDAVITHANDNPAIVATVPAFQTAMADFEIVFTDLKSKAQQEIAVIAGVTLDKSEQRKQLADETAKLAAAVYAFAAASGNTILREQVDYSSTALLRHKDELMAPVCKNILDLANINAAALVPYGITPAFLASLQVLITNFNLAVPAPRNAAANRSGYLTAIKNLFDQGDNILKKQLDKLALQFKDTEPQFYNAYKSNRIIIDPSVSSTQVQGVIISDINDIGLYNVQVTVQDQEYSAVSNALGEYTLKIPVPGTYILKFASTGFLDKTIPNITVKLGQTTPLNVTLNTLPA